LAVAGRIHSKTSNRCDVDKMKRALQRHLQFVQTVADTGWEHWLTSAEVKEHFGYCPIGKLGRVEHIERSIVPPPPRRMAS
jgi:hypothetical protein